MGKKKFYAVRKGYNPGIYTTWAECQTQVRGYPGQEFSGFETLDEAKSYMGGKSVVKSSSTKTKNDLLSSLQEPTSHVSDEAMAESFAALFEDKKLPLVEVQEFSAMQERPIKLPEDLIIYTDGSCYNATAIREKISGQRDSVLASGGYCAVVLDGNMNELCRLTGGEPETTNNRMELTAIKEALEYCNDGRRHKIKIISDSEYAQKTTEQYLPGWKKRAKVSLDEVELIKSDGKKASNQDLIKEVERLKGANEVVFQWVKGHAQNKYNEMCDVAAKNESKRQNEIKGYRAEMLRRKKERADEELANMKKEQTKILKASRNPQGLGR